jgi:hypothetical protein
MWRSLPRAASLPITRGEIHQGALLHALRRLSDELARGNAIQYPKAFLQKIVEAENGRYQEQEEQIKKERLQPSREEAMHALRRIGGILKRR